MLGQYRVEIYLEYSNSISQFFPSVNRFRKIFALLPKYFSLFFPDKTVLFRFFAVHRQKPTRIVFYFFSGEIAGKYRSRGTSDAEA